MNVKLLAPNVTDEPTLMDLDVLPRKGDTVRMLGQELIVTEVAWPVKRFETTSVGIVEDVEVTCERPEVDIERDDCGECGEPIHRKAGTGTWLHTDSGFLRCYRDPHSQYVARPNPHFAIERN